MRKRLLIKTSMILICAALCLCSCQNTQKKTSVATEVENNKKTEDNDYDTPITETQDDSKEETAKTPTENNGNTAEEGTSNTTIENITDTGAEEIVNTTIEKATNTKQKVEDVQDNTTLLTEKFLTGSWINNEGFVCSYIDDVFVNALGTQYKECKIKKGYVVGLNEAGDAISTKITIVDDDTIKIGKVTANRVSSKKGKEYLTQLRQLFEGSWRSVEEYVILEFDNGKASIAMEEYEDIILFKYKFVEDKLKFIYDDGDEEEVLYFDIQISNDTLTIFNETEKEVLFRTGSMKVEDAITWEIPVVIDDQQDTKDVVVIDNYVTITSDENHTITRPEVTGYQNLGWMVLYNGSEVLHRNAENEYSYQYFDNSKGTYEIYLTAYVSGQYVAISNKIKYTIE